MLTQKDEFEQQLHKSVKQMEPSELLDYIQLQFKSKFGYELPVEREREVSMLKRLKKTYGADAGYILKWYFEHHGGESTYRSGRVHKFKMSWLAASQKYWLDELFEEVQEQKMKERKELLSQVEDVKSKDDPKQSKTKTREENNGFATLDELMGR